MLLQSGALVAVAQKNIGEVPGALVDSAGTVELLHVVVLCIAPTGGVDLCFGNQVSCSGGSGSRHVSVAESWFTWNLVGSL